MTLTYLLLLPSWTPFFHLFFIYSFFIYSFFQTGAAPLRHWENSTGDNGLKFDGWWDKCDQVSFLKSMDDLMKSLG